MAQRDPIGTVDNATGAVSVRHSDGTTGMLAKGAPIYQGDLIETGGDGRVGVVFLDKSSFSLGPKGRMAMDEMVFDPTHPQDGHSAVAALGGAFSFVSGQIAKAHPDAMTIKTPVMTIGVRGTSGAGKAAAEGSENTITLLRDGDGALGEIVISNATGSIRLNAETHTIQLNSFVMAPAPPRHLSAAEVNAAYGLALEAQPNRPASPPANPPADNNGTQGDSGQTEADLTKAHPSDEVVQFVTAALDQIADPKVKAELLDVLGDLTDWLMWYGDEIDGDLTELVGDLEELDNPLLADDDDDEDGDEWDDEDGDDHHYTIIAGTPGNDNPLYGSSGNDHISALAGNDVIYAEDGDDYIDPGTGADVIWAGDGNDWIDLAADGSNDVVHGGSGMDTISYAMLTTGAVTVDLSAGTATGGGIGSDSFTDVENVEGSLGGDTIVGNGVTNVIWSGAGDDIVDAGGGDDVVLGGGGNDFITGGAGDDYMMGEGGNDTFFEGDGVDAMDGGDGRDMVSFVNSLSGVIANLSNNAATADGFADTSVLLNIEDLDGSLWNDTLFGSAADNLLRGQDGDDTLKGFNGNDTLVGGQGTDQLWGGAGSDIFRFAGGTGATNLLKATSLGTDAIKDFDISDVIELENNTFGLGVGPLSAAAYHEDTALPGSATNWGAVGRGIIVIQAGANLEVYFCEDMSQAASGNSYQIATIENTSLSAVSDSTFIGAS